MGIIILSIGEVERGNLVFFICNFSNFFSFLAFLSHYSALAWGSSVKHQPQKVGIEHILFDEDVVQIIKKI